MNKWIASASALMFVTLIAHVFGGGPEVIDVVAAANLPDTVRALSSVVWHGTTLMLAISVIALAYLATRHNPALEVFIAVWQIGLAALFIGYGLIQLGSLWPMPQWIVFLLMPAITFVGSRNRQPAT